LGEKAPANTFEETPQFDQGFPSGEGGIRTTPKTPANPELLDQRAAKSDALAITDPDLLQVVRSGPDLPDPIRLAVLALVRSRLA
jgi:hypothetical protein